MEKYILFWECTHNGELMSKYGQKWNVSAKEVMEFLEKNKPSEYFIFRMCDRMGTDGIGITASEFLKSLDK